MCKQAHAALIFGILLTFLCGDPVGITNCTGTLCYANSIMQNLFYLPAIRKGVFHNVKGPHSKVIEVQLACAFGRMQAPQDAVVDLNMDFYPAYDSLVTSNGVQLEAYEYDDPYAFLQWIFSDVIPWSTADHLFGATRVTRLYYAGIPYRSQTVSEPIIPIGASITDLQTISLEDFLAANLNADINGVVIEKPAYRTIASRLQAAGAKWGFPHSVVQQTELQSTGPLLALAFLPRTFSDFETRLLYKKNMTVLGQAYHLNGLVVAEPGHFYAYVKTDLFRHTWHRLDDSSVKPASIKQVLKQQRNVYLLFYVRDDMLSSWRAVKEGLLYNPEIPEAVLSMNAELYPLLTHLFASFSTFESCSYPNVDSDSGSSCDSDWEAQDWRDDYKGDLKTTRKKRKVLKSKRHVSRKQRRRQQQLRKPRHRSNPPHSTLLWLLGICLVLLLMTVIVCFVLDRDQGGLADAMESSDCLSAPN